MSELEKDSNKATSNEMCFHSEWNDIEVREIEAIHPYHPTMNRVIGRVYIQRCAKCKIIRHEKVMV